MSKTETVTRYSVKETQVFPKTVLKVIIRPEFTYSPDWRNGDMLKIDNRATLHNSRHDYDHKHHRHVLRSLGRGDRPR